MNNNPRGTLVQQGNIMRVSNAYVEEASCREETGAFIVISYFAPGAGNSGSVQNVRLNLNRNTVILNSNRQRMCLCCIREGMWVDAVFSSRMTRSIPPQSNAFFIFVRRSPQTASFETTERIAFVDPAGRFITTGNPADINSQARFIISDVTTITDRAGRLTDFRALRPGQRVRITHANFQTASIPPQTTAFHIQIL